MEKLCPVHGLVKYNVYKAGPYTKYRCGQCQNAAVNKRRKQLKVEAVNYLGGACLDCDYSKTISALEFHHVDPHQKEFGISTSGGTKSLERLKVELDKCILLCANCHREEHARLEDGEYDMTPTGFRRTLLFTHDEIST